MKVPGNPWIALLLLGARQGDRWRHEETSDTAIVDASEPLDEDKITEEAPTGLPNLSWENQENLSTDSPGDEAEAPSSVTSLTGARIRALGARDVPGILRSLTGTDVIRTSPTESSVSVRGYGDIASSAQGILADRDGQSAYNDFFGGVFWSILPVNLDDVESIQMIRGPGSYLLGPNAEHGVFRILTPSALEYSTDPEGSHSSFSISSIHGERDSTLGALTQAWWADDQGLKVTFLWDDIDAFEDDQDDVGDRTSLELRWTSRVDTGYRFELTGGINEARTDILVALFSAAPVHLLSDIRETSLKANFGPDDRTAEGFRGQAYWIGFESRSEEDGTFPGFGVDLDTLDLDLRYSDKTIGGHRITTGFVHRYSRADSSDVDVTDGSIDANVTSGLVQGEFDVGERLSLIGGFRLDEHSAAGLTGSPRLAAVWELGELQFLRFSAGYGFRNPSLREQQFQLDLKQGGMNVGTIVGNDDLEAEWMRSFELGYYRRSEEPGYQMGATLFYNLIDDLIEFVANEVGEIQPVNDLNERAYGVELEGRYLLRESLWAFGNYAYVQREDRDTGIGIRAPPATR